MIAWLLFFVNRGYTGVKRTPMTLISSTATADDPVLDTTLRPQGFGEYIGQEKIKRNLGIFIEAARKRGDPVEHVLFYGPAGLGKTTLSHIIAKEMGVGMKVTSGPAIERVGDLGSILTNLENGDVLFIDEIHRLNKLIEEVLYPAMEDYKLDIIIGKGPSARTIQLDLPKFTLIGATTRLGAISNPLRNRFGSIHRLEFYSEEEISRILKRSSRILSIGIDPSGAEKIAKASRRTPRVANRLLKRARDFAQLRRSPLTRAIVGESLSLLEIDELGLAPLDRALLTALIERFGGGPAGVGALAAALSEELNTISDVHEPYLLRLGLIERTPRGRVATRKAYEHLGFKAPDDLQEKLIG